MAPAVGNGSAQTALVSQGDLAEIGENLKQHFSSLIEQKLDPIARQLTDLTTIMKEITTTTDLAYDLSKAIENQVNEPRAFEHLFKDRNVWLEVWARTLHLEFRGLPESTDLNSN